MIQKNGFIVFCVFLLFSCGKQQTSFNSEKDFQDYLNNPENGFIKSFQTKDLLFETKLIPPYTSDSAKIVSVHLRISRIDGLSVLDLEGKNQEDRLKNESYLSFEINKDAYLMHGEQIIPTTFSHYERNYGMKPSIDITFEFTINELSDDVYFVYNDLLFGQGMIKVSYSKNLFFSCNVQ